MNGSTGLHLQSDQATPEDSIPFPPSPGDVHNDALRPSRSFRAGVFTLFAALILFALVYLLLVAAAVVLAGAACALGYFIISVRINFVTVMVGLGLIGTGLMVMAFLLKSLFARFSPDESQSIEISESDQPELVEFVRKVAMQAGARLPKKIVLAPEVNAAVTFDSTFLSMFFPVRKNLHIGLGLVNTLNLGEFKAVLAHEFGHFSQKSMKLGSYTYTVNRILFNLLFENTAYNKALQAWASVSKYFEFFAHVTVLIVEEIQWVLRKLYGVVQKAYFALSREMEFHADAVSASVAGSRQVVSSLYRLEVAGVAFSTMLDAYARRSSEKARPDNAYEQQRALLKEYAEDMKIPMDEGVPLVDGSSPRPFVSSRVLVRDQWSSHPSTRDREQRVNALGYVAEPVRRPAWALFRDPVALQQRMTTVLFPAVPEGQLSTVVDTKEFLERRRKRLKPLVMPKVFRGFFDLRRPELLHLDPLQGSSPAENAISLELILSEERLGLPTAVSVLEQDIAWLEAIDSKLVDVRLFEFDGVKHDARDAPDLLRRLKGELQDAQQRLAATDRSLCMFFLGKAREASKENEYVARARDFTALQKRVEEINTLSGEFKERVDALSRHAAGDAQARDIVDTILRMEARLKTALRAILEEDRGSLMDEDARASLESFLNGTSEYLTGRPVTKLGKAALADDETEYECSECGTTVPPEMERCPRCGTTLHEEGFVCSDCGKDIQPGQKACPHCGSALEWGEGEREKDEKCRCLQCGAAVTADQVECSNCGRILLGPPPDEVPVTVPPEEEGGEKSFVEEDFHKLFGTLQHAEGAGQLALRIALKRLLTFQAGLLEVAGKGAGAE